MSRRLAFLLVFVLASARLSAAAELIQKWKIDGVEREGLIYAPLSATSEPTPLLFAFHGHGGSMHQAARSFDYQKLWPEAIVIYLQGLDTPGLLTDPKGQRAGWQGRAGAEKDRDLKLFDHVLKWAKETYKVDNKRIYCAGHSNGGGFTYLLWAERPGVFAAVAPASAAGLQVIKKLKPMPMLAIGGLNDPLVKFSWQKTMIDAVRKIDGCDPDGQTEGKLITVYPSSSGTPVETYLYDGGHMVPNDAWAEVVKFFKAHPGK